MAPPRTAITLESRHLELMAQPRLTARSAAFAAAKLPWMTMTFVSDAPVFVTGKQPQATTKAIVADKSGKRWAPLLYWLDGTVAAPVPRFNTTGLTIDLRPSPNPSGDLYPAPDAFLPLEPTGWRAYMEGTTDDVQRDMTYSWDEDDSGVYRLTLTYDFKNDNERELIRGAIRGGGLKITVQWTHRAGHQEATTTTLDFDAASIGAARISPAVLAAARLGVGREAVIRPRPFPTPRPTPTPPPTPPPTPTQPAPPTYYTFAQTVVIAINRPNPADAIWQDGPSPWRTFRTASGRTMYYRATGRPAEYEFLPTEFRLGFDTVKGTPALLPFVYNPKDAAGALVADDRRIEVRLMATPHVEAADREALRQGIAAAEKVELALLVPPVLTGRFEIDVNLLGAQTREQGETVQLDGVFWIEIDFALESWAPNLEQLSLPGGGVVGKVLLDILPETEGEDVSIPVALRLSDLHADVIEVVRSDADEDGVQRRFLLRNRVDRSVRMAGPPTVFLAKQAGNAAMPTSVRTGRPKGDFDPQLGPGEEREVEVEPASGTHQWNALVVDLANVDVEAPAEGWVDEINVKASDGQAMYPVTVRAVNLRDDATVAPQYDSTWISLKPLTGGSAEPPDGRIEKGSREWSTKMWLGLAELWALEKDPATTKLHAIELRSDYDDLEGLPQRVTGSAANVTVRALTTERSTSRYDLLDEDGTVLSENIDRDTAKRRIEQRRAAGLSWTLRLQGVPVEPDPPPEGDTTPGNTTPGNTTPVDPPPAGPPITVNPVALDFSAISKVFVTLKIGSGDQLVSHTLVIENNDAQVWAPIREPGTPVAYTMVYVFADARPPKTISGTETSDLVMVLDPSS